MTASFSSRLKRLAGPRPPPGRAFGWRRKRRSDTPAFQFLGGQSKILKECQSLFQSRGHQKVSLERQLPHKKLEYRSLLHSSIEVTLQHRQLIEIG